MKILIVLTSHDQLGDTGKKTGFWLEEFAAPYYVLEGFRGDDHPGHPEGRPTATRSDKRSTRESDRINEALSPRPLCPK